MVAGAVTYKFTVDEYHRMADAGIFKEDDRVELISGEIVRMSAIGNRHLGTLNSLVALFAPLSVAKRAVISAQNPVILSEDSEPEPDLALLKYSADFYRNRKPGPADVMLLIEVADSSLNLDRLQKVPLYLGCGIPEVWLVDLVAEHIEVYRPSSSGTAAEPAVFGRGGSLSPHAFPDITARVEDIIGE